MENEEIHIDCRQCPDNNFDLKRMNHGRYMAICHAVECIVHPEFPDNKINESQFLSKANLNNAIFKPLDNCPCIEKLRNEGKLPWAYGTIDFSKNR